jgi:hypothetical protein
VKKSKNKTIKLSTEFGSKTILYARPDGKWRIKNDDESFHYHTNEVIEMLEQERDEWKKVAKMLSEIVHYLQFKQIDKYNKK